MKYFKIFFVYFFIFSCLCGCAYNEELSVSSITVACSGPGIDFVFEVSPSGVLTTVCSAELIEWGVDGGYFVSLSAPHKTWNQQLSREKMKRINELTEKIERDYDSETAIISSDSIMAEVIIENESYISMLLTKKEDDGFGAKDIDTNVQELTYLLIEETRLDVGGSGNLVRKGQSTFAKVLKQVQRQQRTAR